MPKFAANLSLLFVDLPFLDRFAAARAHGFEAVEFLFPYAFDADQIAERLARHGLQLVLHNFPAGDWDGGDRGMACDPRRVGEFQDSVARALAYAQALGTPRLHCMAGKPPPDVSAEQARATYLANLRFAADACRPHGVKVLIEPLNTFDVPGYFLTSNRQALALIAEAGSDKLFLQFDVYHTQRMHGELANTLRACLPSIAHIQIADNPGRHQPGTGEINFPFLLKLIDELGYDGWVGCEFTALGDITAALAWRDALT